MTWGHQEGIDFAGDFAELTEEYDWGWFADHIYVYSPVDPGIAYAAIELSQRQYAIGMADNDPKEHIIIDGLELLFTQSKGFYAGYPAREAHDLTIRNCHIGYVGIKGAASAYGLAVWYSDMLVQNNEIHDCGRRSVSYNVYATRNVTFANVTIEGNYFHHGFHTTGIDIANSGTDQMINFVVRNNCFVGDPTVDLGASGCVQLESHLDPDQPGRVAGGFFLLQQHLHLLPRQGPDHQRHHQCSRLFQYLLWCEPDPGQLSGAALLQRRCHQRRRQEQHLLQRCRSCLQRLFLLCQGRQRTPG